MLFRRHVGRRPQQRTGAGQRQARRRARVLACLVVALVGEPDETEIGHEHTPVVVRQDVVRLEVPVNQPGVMSGRQAPPGADQHVDDLRRRPLAGAQPFAERSAAHQLHGDEGAPVDDAHVVDRHHVRVREARHRPRLAPHAGRARGVRRIALAVAEDLDCHVPMELRIVGSVHGAHRSGPEELAHDVPSGVCPRGQRGACRRRVAPLRHRLRPRLDGCEGPHAVGATGQVLLHDADFVRGEVAAEERGELLLRQARHRL